MSDGLQVEEHLGFQRAMWRAERIGWALMAVVVVAALVGLFGVGPLSHSSVTSDDGLLTVDYLRFARAGGTSELSLEVDAALVEQDQVAVVLDRSFIDSVDIEHVTPQPAAEVATAEGIRFTFDAAATGGTVRLSFAFRPQAMGTVRAAVAVPDGPRVDVPQLFYP